MTEIRWSSEAEDLLKEATQQRAAALDAVDSEQAISDWLTEIGGDARVTSVTTDESEIVSACPECEICFGPAETLWWDAKAGYGKVLTVDAWVETTGERTPSGLLGDGSIPCCCQCRDVLLSLVNAERAKGAA